MALRTHILPSERPHHDLVEVDESMFPGYVSPCEIILHIPGIENSDLDEVA
jgi:hypothetical protein